MALISLSAYAKKHGASKQAASKWKKRELIVIRDNLVDEEASDRRMEHAGMGRFGERSTVVNRSTAKPIVENEVLDHSPAPENVSARTVVTLQQPQPGDGETLDQFVRRTLAEGGAPYTQPEAERVKENYLALLRQLEYDLKSGAVVLVTEIAAKVGTEYAAVRTRLSAIPAEMAPRLHRCKTAVELQDVLHEAIVRALEELSLDRTGVAA